MTAAEQRARYARRVWADAHIGATVTPETAHTPLPPHGPITRLEFAFGPSFFPDMPASAEFPA